MLKFNQTVFWVLPLFLIVLLQSQEQWVSAAKAKEEEVLVYLPDEPNATCPDGYLQCSASRQCILETQHCDGRIDCYDFSDEFHCGEEADDEFFDQLFTKRPTAIRDEIPEGECRLPPVSINCTCEGVDLFCRYMNLTSIPTDLPQSKLLLLDLTGNYFPEINDTLLNDMPRMHELSLAYCNISFISPNAFQRFSDVAVTKVHLEQNSIISLNHTLFAKGNEVEVLFLSGNMINILHDYDFLNLKKLWELDLRDNLIETFDAKVFESLTKLEFLILTGNRVTHLDSNMFPVMQKLHTLELSDNRIERIEANTFNMKRLTVLHLSKNRLTQLEGRTFCGLENLGKLYLNKNKLQKFDLHSFDCVERLNRIWLTDNELKFLDKRVLQNLSKLEQVTFDWFHLCQSALHVPYCTPTEDGISSTTNLLNSPVLRGVAYTISFIAFAGNLLMFLHRFNTRNDIGLSVYLRHLAVSGFLMSIYLAIISIADMNSRGEYIDHDESWRHSGFCAFAGFLNTLSCQSALMILSLMTWDRMMYVIRPLQARNARKKKLIVRLSTLWSLSFVLAALPLIPFGYFGSHFYGANGVCLPLHIHDPYAQGWEYSALLYICFNTCSIIFILNCYFRMRWANRLIVAGTRRMPRTSDIAVAKRFNVILFSDCVCWLPIIIVKLVALSGFAIESHVYSWLAVMVLPVSAAINPVLYFVVTAVLRQQLRPYNQPMPVGIALLERPQVEQEADSPTSATSTEQPSTSSKGRTKEAERASKGRPSLKSLNSEETST